MCHLAVKSCGNNRITFPIRPNVIEPYIAHNGEGEDRGSVTSVQMSQAQ